MSMSKGASLALAAGCVVFSPFSAVANASTSMNNGLEIPRCTQNIGTVVVVESQAEVFGHMGMNAPASLLRHLVRESGCFTLIQRAAGASAVAPRIPEFAISAEMVNEIEIGDGRTGILGAVSRNRLARSTANVFLESSTGGLVNMDRINEGVDMMHDGRLDAAMDAAAEVAGAAVGGAARLGGAALTAGADGLDTYNRMQMRGGVVDPQAQGAAIGARVGGQLLSSMGEAMSDTSPVDRSQVRGVMGSGGVASMMNDMMPQARILGLGPRRSDEELLARGVSELQRDIERGRTNAEFEMFVVSIPLGEVVGESNGSAGRNEVRRQRIGNNAFGGRVGRGYEDSDEGKAISLAVVSAYTDMVTRLGGMGSTTPEITLATRDAVRRAEDAERQRQAEEERRLAQASRPAPRGPARPRHSQARQQQAVAPSSAEVLRNALLRDGPSGAVIAQLTAGETVYPTGSEEDGWREVEDSVGNLGWTQADRLFDLD